MSDILIVEDDEQLSRLLELELMYNKYTIHKAVNGMDGLEQIKLNQFDLVLLDVMLPGIDGMEICRRARRFTKVPIIMLTAKDTLHDKIMGLDIGADDYITKPFETQELLARIRAILRRNKEESTDESKIYVDDLELDRLKREVKRGKTDILLSKKEFDLLEYMMVNKNIVLSRDNLLQNVWGFDFLGDSNIVDVFIRYLRRKVDEPFEAKLIYTYRGVGYAIKENIDV